MTKSCDNEAREISKEDAAERDRLLRNLMKTPPQPRPKRERDKADKHSWIRA